MGLPILDVVVFVVFVVTVISVGILKSRNEKDSESYFLAGRGLSWWLIGFSLIAANISTEQFVGMSGNAADYVGLAIASYEWMAAVTLIVVAFFFLPTFLRAGIYTIPEFLEYRYNRHARAIMSLFMMITYVAVTIAAVVYSGALTIVVRFRETALPDYVPVNLWTASALIGFVAVAYVAAGGLKACVWADLIQGAALILGGTIILVLALHALGTSSPESLGLEPGLAAAGAAERFYHLNADKLHMKLPSSDPFVPWTALVIGLWIPNFYYWGLNQYITQRTLGAKSLGQGQKGIVFAAAMKLLIPFIVVFPGMIAFNLYKNDMRDEAAQGSEATPGNDNVLAAFARAKENPAEAKAAFRFNADFAMLNLEQARELSAFNARLAGTSLAEIARLESDKPKELAEANNALLKTIGEKNKKLPASGQVKVQQELIGYKFDSAFGLLLKKLVPVGYGLEGFIFAALLGAVVSSLAAMLNAASTIFTMDLYKQYIHKQASQATLVAVGRVCVFLFAIIGCTIAPFLNDPRFKGIFTYIQEFQGFISPGILGVFIFGLFVHRAPRSAGAAGLLISPAVYGLLKLFAGDLAFLDRMAITFACVLAAMAAMTLLRPLRVPVTLPVNANMSLESSKTAKVFGVLVVAATACLYVIFW